MASRPTLRIITGVALMAGLLVTYRLNPAAAWAALAVSGVAWLLARHKSSSARDTWLAGADSWQAPDSPSLIRKLPER